MGGMGRDESVPSKMGGMGPNADGEWVHYAHKCPTCGFHLPLPEYAGKHCPKCGGFQPKPMTGPKELPAHITCPECSAACLPNDKFCTNCGAKLPCSPPNPK